MLVHCFAGVSRSATTVLAYIMHRFGLTLPAAFKYIKACRGCINPSEDLCTMLLQFETGLREKR